MTDESGVQPGESSGNDTTVYRPGPDGGLEAATAETGDYRDQLHSRRWGAAPLKNPEAEKTDPRIAVAFIAGLSAITFIMLLIGYGSGFWD
jgi:hypothetical protein